MDSNSLFFEKEKGWTGICAEANPKVMDTLRHNRGCIVHHCALTDRDDYAVPYVSIAGGLFGWGGVREGIEPQHQERIERHTRPEDRETILVPSITLDSLLSKYGFKRIDYMTLDIEGMEFKVLSAFPFEKYDIEIMEIEDNFGNYPIEALMILKGFTKINRMGVSDIYRKVRV